MSLQIIFYLHKPLHKFTRPVIPVQALSYRRTSGVLFNQARHRPPFAYAKTKAQINCAITAPLICLLNLKIQASIRLLLLYSPFCVICRTWSEATKTCFLMTWLNTLKVRTQAHVSERTTTESSYKLFDASTSSTGPALFLL